MIELTHASFQYENSDRGVQDISILVKSGECVVLTGLSGCGKTTVTRLVNGLAPSYYPGVFSGSVRIDGKDISRLSTWEIGRLVGSVFQDPKSQFFSSELAGEVAFPCENYGLSAREIRERTDAAIEALQLSHLKDRAVDALSSGEKQRAAIASVYAMKPKVFVCDEPTANLDAAGTRQLAQTLRQLKEQGFTLLIAEHRIDWLMGIADRFLYLRDGRIAAEYTPEDLLILPEADILGMGLRSPHEGKSLPAPSVLDESPAVLKTAGLSKRIRKEVIFEDISLSVPEGKVTAITGQNGAGENHPCADPLRAGEADKGAYPDRREKSKNGSPAQGDLLLRQRHVNAVLHGKRGGGAAAEYRIDRRKQRPGKEPAQRVWALRVQGRAPVCPVRRAEAAPCHRLRHLFRPQDTDS